MSKSEVRKLRDRVNELEGIVLEIKHWYEYQLRLHPIPISDRKAFPQKGENPYFKAGPFMGAKSNIFPKVKRITNIDQIEYQEVGIQDIKKRPLGINDLNLMARKD